MKKSTQRACALALSTALGSSLAQAADIGVSVQISQPGVYGRIDIGQFPQPRVIVAQPVLIMRAPAVQRAEPVYMWVPPGHRKHWRKHCAQYAACGVPVYFVQDRWYDDHVQRPARGRAPAAHGSPPPHRDDRADVKGKGHDAREGKPNHGRGGDKRGD